jgi:hypothetical protein
MKRWIALLFVLFAFVTFLPSLSAVEKNPLDLSIKKIYATPSEDSNLVLDIPIEVKLLDISKDANWYKVKIAYSIGPLHYTYVGWAQIPIAESLAERLKDKEEIVSLPTEKP